MTLAPRPWLPAPVADRVAAIEQIEIIAAELAARVFHAGYAEVRVGSGALANLYAFMRRTIHFTSGTPAV